MCPNLVLLLLEERGEIDFTFTILKAIISASPPSQYVGYLYVTFTHKITLRCYCKGYMDID